MIDARRALASSALLLSTAAAVALAVPARASAQIGWAVHGEGGAAVMISSHQRDVLGFDWGVAGALRPGLRIADVFAAELALGGLAFPHDGGVGTLFLAGGGARFEPMLGDAGRIFVDAHASYGLSSDLSRFSFDAGAGFEGQVGDIFGIGP